MEQKRQRAVEMLSELKKVKFTEPTARELHSKRSGLSRVYRQEMKRYKLGIERKKVKLTKDISDIDRYLQSVRDHEAYLASLPKKPKKLKRRGVSQSQMPSQRESLIQAPVVLSVPTIVLGRKPVLKKTRLSRYTQRRRLR